MLALPDDSPGAGGFVQFWHDTALYWLIGTAFLAMLASWWVIPDRALSDATDAILDEFREALFGDIDDDDANHRITLFKQVRLQPTIRSATGWCWPGGGWLVPVARSGHGTKNTRIRFRSPDDPTEAEGIAGKAWARPMVLVSGLPDLTDSSCSDSLESYAEATSIPVTWVQKRVRKGKPTPRSLMGFRVEDKQGDPWGVLVIDSRSPTPKTKVAQEEFNAYAPVLARLVESM